MLAVKQNQRICNEHPRMKLQDIRQHLPNESILVTLVLIAGCARRSCTCKARPYAPTHAMQAAGRLSWISKSSPSYPLHGDRHG